MFSMLKKVFSIIIAFFTLLFSGADLGEELPYLRFETDVSFTSLSADELPVTEDEKTACRTWYEENVLYAGQNEIAPAYDFSVNGIPLSMKLSDWQFTVTPAAENRKNGETSVITLTNEKAGLQATVEATLYIENATCEWTVSVQNTAEKRSGVLSGFHAINCTLPVDDAEIYFSRGSADNAADFTMLHTDCSILPTTVSAKDGRSTTEFLPYFNLNGESCGVVLGIGWSGLWEASFKNCSNGLLVNAGQKNLLGYLEPGESVRSPLVSLTFYNSENPVKGFNAFRNWIKDCVYPDNVPTVQNNMDILFVSNTRTAAEIFYDLEHFDNSRAPYIDNYWMDAGWYAGCEESWADGVGNWTTSETRFPDGIKAISDYAADYEKGIVLWYEPERLTSNSYLYSVGSQHEDWIVDLDPKADFNQTVMWNLGNEEACAFLSEYISSSLIENGVAIYRQDFNFSPTEFWQHLDLHANGGRIGFAENHYITGLYTYLDALFEAIPGLVMDNCASGGRRLDLEMTHRSVPMWRSDYNCDQTRPDLLDATQAHTYGLSFWLPVSGTFINYDTEYGMRSSIMPILQVPMASPESALTAYRAEREAQMQGFFPLSFGGTDPEKITAMQYGDETTGCALIYAHAEHEADSFAVHFSGLKTDTVYAVTDADTPDTTSHFTGEELMAGAYSVSFPDGRKAIVLNYTAQ